ncbi:hypothetical protein IWW50_000836 [Coemansia erecta]|nr:hypothetical protein IWW50_000836 [Coemansia erecta]
MGCCQSTAADTPPPLPNTPALQTGLHGQQQYEPPQLRATIDFGHSTTWTSEEPITKAQLERKREEFWDTAPAFEGRLETWLALRLACDSDDEQFAQAILTSAGATVPSQRIVDGVFDELGASYVVPQYCLSEPTNLITDSVHKKTVDAQASMDSGLRTAVVGSPSSIPLYRIDSDDMSEMSASSPLYPPGSTSSDAGHKPIKVRLSTGKDVTARLAPDTTVAQLEQQMREAGHLMGGRVRFFYLGRPLASDLVPARDLRLTKHVILQVLM